MPIPVSDLQQAAPSAIIELYELQLFAGLHGDGSIYRFHDGTGSTSAIVWAGNTYQAIPVQVDGFEYTGNGQLPQPTLRVSNIAGTITAILATVNTTTPGNDLIGSRITRIRTLVKYIDNANFPNGNPFGTPDSTVEFPREVYYIVQKTTENREIVEFALAASFDLQGVRAPKRQCISSICQWVYRSAECGYTGSFYYDANDNSVGSVGLDVCGKRLSSCAIRFGRTANLSTVGTTATLNAGSQLLGSTQQKLVAANGWYQLIMQSDGNLVIYDKAGTPIWSTVTSTSTGDAKVIMQNDGNLVLYQVSTNTALWASDTSGSGANRAILQNDGNLVLYTASNVAVWSSDSGSQNEPANPNTSLPFGSFPGVGRTLI